MHKRIFAASMAAIILTGYAAVYAGPVSREYRQALNLYQRGMYEQARSMFESIIAESDDVMAEGYAVLCAVKMQSDGYQTLVDDYDYKYPESSLRSQIHYLNALNLFDAENYEAASAEFSRVNPKAIYKEQTPEFIFKQSYSAFGIGNYDAAVSGFSKVESMPFSDFTAPSRYALGYIDYIREDFDGAFKWFSQSVKDHRFAEMSSYYMLECRFMNKDYRYVVENGVTMYDKVPEDRKPHLARIISEAYLVLGDPGKAREYYETTVLDKPNMNRSDYFYAGTVLYSVEDWQGAIDNFSKMVNRTDSLGQKANYNLGFAYIQTKNKVAAMGAFKDAADYAYDKDIQEDAYFNYAKLAFDLNHDGSAFSDYIAKYADSKRGDSIYNYMALACLYNHDYAGAVEAYDNIDELDESMRSNYMKANYLRANQLVENGSYRDAVPCLRAASFFTDKHDTFNQLSRFWLAESYFRSGKYLESRSIFSDLYNLSALDGHMEGDLIPYNIGYCYFMEEDYKAASEWFGRYLEGNASEYGKEAAVRKADCDFIQKKYGAAVEGYNKVIAQYDNLDDLYPYYQCGLAYGLDGKKQKKVEILENAKKAPVSAAYYPETMYELGRAYVAVDDYDDAILCFKNLRGDSIDQEYAAKSLIELGMIYNNKGDYNQALSYYKDVVAKMQGTEYAQDALQAIESIYQIKGEADQYLAYAESIGATTNKTDAEKEDLYFVAAERVYLAGNYQKALTSLDTYRSKYPNGSKASQADFYSAESFLALGQKESAVDFYKKSMVASNPYLESAIVKYSDLSYSMEHYSDAFSGYSKLLSEAKMDQNKKNAQTGMMRSAFRAKDYSSALVSADRVKNDKESSSALVREADYVKAKSYLATSQRDKAFEILNHLAKYPSTNEGAEASYLIIQDAYDQGSFDKIQDKVFDFAEKAEGQNYWLAKAYIVLGDTYVENDNLSQAMATFESLRDGYTSTGSSDDVLDNVAMRLQKLEKLLTK